MRTIWAGVAVVLAAPAMAAPDATSDSAKAQARERSDKIFQCVANIGPQRAYLMAMEPPARMVGHYKALNKSFVTCLTSYGGGQARFQHYPARGSLALAFLQRPEHLPKVRPAFLRQAEPSEWDVADKVGRCVVARDAEAARAFIDTVTGLPAEREAFLKVQPLFVDCLQADPDVEMNGPVMRAALAVALLERAESGPSVD